MSLFKIEKDSKRTTVKVLGIKMKFRNTEKLFKGRVGEQQCDSFGNKIYLGSSNIKLNLKMAGKNNRIHINASESCANVELVIYGDNNDIFIGKSCTIRNLYVACGNQGNIANDTQLSIQDGTSIEDAFIMLFNTGNKCIIGKDCMISKDVQIRCGELPHIILDSTTGENLDVSEGVFIGDHVWIGEAVWVMKKCTIPDNCIVGSASVATKRFTEKNTVIAGNPAKIVRSNVQWVRERQG